LPPSARMHNRPHRKKSKVIESNLRAGRTIDSEMDKGEEKSYPAKQQPSRSWRSMEQDAGFIAVLHLPHRRTFQEVYQRTVRRHQHILNAILVEHSLGIFVGGCRQIILEYARGAVRVSSAIDEDLHLRCVPDQVSAPKPFMKHPALNSFRSTSCRQPRPLDT